MPPRTTAPSALALALAFALAGCTGEAAPPPPPADYLALADGNRWAYESTVGPGTSEYMKATDDTLSEGRAVLRLDSTLQFTSGVSAMTMTQYLLQTPRELAVAYDTDAGEPWASLGSQPRLRLPLRAGDSYVLREPVTHSSWWDRDGDGLVDTITMSTTVTDIAPETVVVPAGRFETLRVTSETRSQLNLTGGGTAPDDVATMVEWYAPGMGIVQKSSTGTSVLPSWQWLTAYRIGGRRSESVAPQLELTFPGDGAVLESAPVSLYAQFNEAMEPYLSHLVLRDAGGAEVAGFSRVHGRWVYFHPEGTLASGSYTASVTGAEDLLGNPAAAVTWSFTVP